MNRGLKARAVALSGSALAGILVLLPIPVMDLLLMIVMQFLIANGVLAVAGKRLGLAKLLPLVLVFSLVGSAISLGLEISLLILGKFLLAPFAFLWCYLLAELVLLVGHSPADPA